MWERAPYQPTRTIVQAAQALYAQHSVEAISRSDAGAKNLQVTSRRIDEIVEVAKGIPRWKVEGGPPSLLTSWTREGLRGR